MPLFLISRMIKQPASMFNPTIPINYQVNTFRQRIFKIFSKSTMKISYSCTSNIKPKITTHNRKILNELVNQNIRKQSCIKKASAR